MVLTDSLCEKGRSGAQMRAAEIAACPDYIVQKDERVVIVDEFLRVTHDSAEKLNGKYLIIPALYNAFLKGEFSKSAFEEYGLVSYAAAKSENGAVFVCRTDREAPMILQNVKTALLIITFITGIAVALVIVLGAYRTRKRMKTIISGIAMDEKQGPIPIQGKDEIAELTKELNKLARQMQETEELRRTFVSDASHELRTPLSSIQLLVDSIIQTENIDMDTTREFMTDVSEQIDRLTRIAERLLLLTNLDGAKELSREPVDMKKVAESVIATLEQSATEAQVELNCSFAEDVIFKGTTDGAYQIIFNLVENAIKYNRPGGSVRVYVFKSDGVCNLIVDDNGIGIPESDFELIFERFYRVDKARSRDKGGSGLGLSIVSKIVGYFDGEIKVEPSVDGGTRFTVTFPGEVAE